MQKKSRKKMPLSADKVGHRKVDMEKDFGQTPSPRAAASRGCVTTSVAYRQGSSTTPNE